MLFCRKKNKQKRKKKPCAKQNLQRRKDLMICSSYLPGLMIPLTSSRMVSTLFFVLKICRALNMLCCNSNHHQGECSNQWTNIGVTMQQFSTSWSCLKPRIWGIPKSTIFYPVTHHFKIINLNKKTYMQSYM